MRQTIFSFAVTVGKSVTSGVEVAAGGGVSLGGACVGIAVAGRLVAVKIASVGTMAAMGATAGVLAVQAAVRKNNNIQKRVIFFISKVFLFFKQ